MNRSGFRVRVESVCMCHVRTLMYCNVKIFVSENIVLYFVIPFMFNLHVHIIYLIYCVIIHNDSCAKKGKKPLLFAVV